MNLKEFINNKAKLINK